MGMCVGASEGTKIGISEGAVVGAVVGMLVTTTLSPETRATWLTTSPSVELYRKHCGAEDTAHDDGVHVKDRHVLKPQ